MPPPGLRGDFKFNILSEISARAFLIFTQKAKGKLGFKVKYKYDHWLYLKDETQVKFKKPYFLVFVIQ